MANSEVAMTLDDCVAEVLGLLTGLDLQYAPEQDRYQAITRALNRALRANATEHEWSYYSDLENVGVVHEGDQEIALRSSVRPRIISDDAVRLTDADGNAVAWAYFLPRDALHKYIGQPGLYAAVTRSSLKFSRPLGGQAVGWNIMVPVMREPRMFRLPPGNATVPDEVREQLLDFDYPDLVILRAAYYYAMTDPIMQPRVPTLENQYKDLGYSLIERDDRFTDAPFQNEWFLPIGGTLDGNNHVVRYPTPIDQDRV